MALFTSAGIAGLLGVSAGLFTTVSALALNAAVGLGLNLLASSIAGKPEQPTFSVQGQLQVGGDIPRSFILGRTATAGSLVYANTWGNAGKTPNAYFTQVIALSDLPVQELTAIWVNGQRCTMITSEPHGHFGFPLLEYRSGGKDHLWVKLYDGNQLAEDPYLVEKVSSAERPYEATRVGVGVAFATCTALINENLFTGFPSYKFEVLGLQLYDITKDSTAGGSGTHRLANPATWGGDGDELPAVQAYNLLLGLKFGSQWFYGLQGMSAPRLPSADWRAQVAKCRLGVSKPGGGTEEQYLTGFEVQVNAPITKAAETILTGCQGRLIDIGGTYKIRVGAPDAAVFSFSDGDILSTERQTFTPFFGLADTINGISATYPEPEEGWNNKAAPSLYRPDYEVRDDNRRLMADVELAAVRRASQVQRLMKSALEEARRARRHTIVLGPAAWVLEPGDVVAWTSGRNGYAAKLMRVDGVIDKANLDVILDLTEVDPAAYNWNPATDFRAPTFGPVGSGRPAAQAIVDWFAQPWTITDAGGGARRPAIKLSWDGEQEDVAAVAFEVRLAATQEVVYRGRTDNVRAASIVISQGLVPAQGYGVRGRYLPAGDRETLWSGWLPVTAPNVQFTTSDILDGAISELKLADRAVSSLKIQLEAVTTELISPNSITNTKLADAAVGASKIANEAVTSLKLADQAVSTAKLQIAAVTQDILANNSVVSSKIGDGAVSITKFADGIEPVGIVDGVVVPAAKTTEVITVAGKLYRWNGSAYVSTTAASDIAGQIVSSQLASAAVTAEKLANAAVTHDKLSAGSVYGDVIAAKSITARELVLTDWSNIADNGWQKGSLSGWDVPSGFVEFYYSPLDGDASGWMARSTAPYTHFASSTIFVSPGETYYLDVWSFNYSTNDPDVHAQIWLFAYDPAGNHATSYFVAGNNIKQAWQHLRGQATVGSGITSVRMVLYTNSPVPLSSQGIVWSKPVMRKAANAELIVDGAVTATKVAANAITADKLAASSVIAGKIAAGAVSVAELAAGAVTADKLAVGVGSNFLVNSDFAVGGIYWGLEWTSAPDGTWSIGMRYDNYGVQPYGSMELYYNGSDTSVVVGLEPKTATGAQKRFPCVAGEWYEFSARYLGHRCRALQLYFGWLNKDGSVIHYSWADFAANQNTDPQYQLGNYQQAFFKAQAPAGATSFYLFARNGGPVSGEWAPYLWLSHLYVGKASANQTQATPWSDGSATLINGGVISALSVQAVSIAAAAITAEKLAVNSVTAAAIAASTITGDKIAANTISGDKFIAGSITARELLLTDWANMVGNGFDQGSLSGWWTEGQQGYYPENGVGASTGGWILQSNARNCAINKATFAVTPGETYYYEVWVYNVGGNPPAGVLLVGRRGDDTSPVYPNHLTSETDYWVRIQGRYTVEPNISKLQFVLFCDKWEIAGPSTYFTKPILRRASGAELIVDGAVTAVKIQAGSITANELGAGSVTAVKLAAGSVTADKMSVATLAAISAVLGNVDISNANIGTLTVGTLNLANRAATDMDVGDGYSRSFSSSFTQIASATLQHGTGAPKVAVLWSVLGPGVAVEYRVRNATSGVTLFTYSFAAANANQWTCIAQDFPYTGDAASLYVLEVRSAQAGSYTHPFGIIMSIVLKR